jgi:hypothetical protein
MDCGPTGASRSSSKPLSKKGVSLRDYRRRSHSVRRERGTVRKSCSIACGRASTRSPRSDCAFARRIPAPPLPRSRGAARTVRCGPVRRETRSASRAFFGTPQCLIGQSIAVELWIAVNAAAVAFRWDPYPFILLNLAFSTQAAYAAPLILLAQTRQTVRWPRPATATRSQPGRSGWSGEHRADTPGRGTDRAGE